MQEVATNPEQTEEIKTKTVSNRLTPKQRFDQEMENVQDHKDNEKRNKMGKEEVELQDEMDEISEEVEETFDDGKKPFDKSMGNKKIIVTKEQHLKNKKNIQDRLAMKHARSAARHSQKHLTNEQLMQMQKILESAEAGKVIDKVLIHLIKRKVILSEQYVVSQSSAGEKHKQMMEEMGKIAEDITKCKGAIENVDKEIFGYIEEMGIEF